MDGLLPVRPIPQLGGASAIHAFQSQSPSWVRLGHGGMSALSPFDSQLRTLVRASRRSHSVLMRYSPLGLPCFIDLIAAKT